MHPVKIGIVGAGAMGCVYGGNLAEAGHEIWLLDVWREHIDAMRTQGLHLSGASGDRVVPLNATTAADEIGPCRVVIIATKAADVEKAARNAGPLIAPETLVLAIQNGINNAQRAARHVEPRQLFIGIAEGFGASIAKPGHAHHHGWEMIHIGPYRSATSQNLQDLEQMWHIAGFNVRIHNDIRPALWSKVVCNVAFSAICTVTELKIGQVMANPHAWQIATACAGEAAEVAGLKKIALPFQDSETWIRDFGRKIPGARPSMLLDLEAGKPSEVDSLNGAVADEAEALGIQAPVNRLMTILVKALEDRQRFLGTGWE